MHSSDFDNNIERIKVSIEKSKFKMTALALFRFYEKIDNIKSALDKFDLKEEIYSGNILFRSLLEHLIISYYIWYKFMLNKNDECAREYYTEYLIHEFFKQEGYKQKLQKIKTKNYNNIDGLGYIKNSFPILNEISETQYQEINKKGNQFQIDRIFDYLINEKPLGEQRKVLHEYMLDFLDTYNVLSSFVHGGPYAEDVAFESKKELLNDAPKKWAESALNTIQTNILFFLCEEDTSYLSIL